VDSIRNLLEAHAGPSASNSKMRFASSEKPDVVGVEPPREGACGAEVLALCEIASLRVSAASSCARSIAMLAMCVTCRSAPAPVETSCGLW